LGAIVFTIQLSLFHFQIYQRGLTTFEYIKIQQEKIDGKKYKSKVIKEKNRRADDQQEEVGPDAVKLDIEKEIE